MPKVLWCITSTGVDPVSAPDRLHSSFQLIQNFLCLFKMLYFNQAFLRLDSYLIGLFLEFFLTESSFLSCLFMQNSEAVINT